MKMQYLNSSISMQPRKTIRWSKNIFLVAAVSVVAMSTTRSVMADQVDEERMLLESRINETIINKQLSSKDSKVIRREMADFKKQKTSMFDASGDRFTAEDDNALDKGLNRIRQDFERMKASQAATKKTESKENTKDKSSS